jgi:hypothetical protein
MGGTASGTRIHELILVSASESIQFLDDGLATGIPR